MMKMIKDIINNRKKAVAIVALALAFIIGVASVVMLIASRAQKPAGGLKPLAGGSGYVLAHKLSQGAEVGGEVLEHHAFIGSLQPDEEYVLALVRDENAAQVMADKNLFYADQGKANENGELSFHYIPRAYDSASLCLFGKDAENASILNWTFSDDRVLTIGGNSGTGVSFERLMKWAGISKTAVEIRIGDGIARVDNFAFTESQDVKSIVIGDTVTEIGEMAFVGCGNVEEVLIPASVKTINDNAFDVDDLIVKGNSGTEAEAFAKRNGYTFRSLNIMRGDVNGDSKVDVTDATLVQLNSAELFTLTGEQLPAADANGDGKVDVTDATYIQLYAAELIDHL